MFLYRDKVITNMTLCGSYNSNRDDINIRFKSYLCFIIIILGMCISIDFLWVFMRIKNVFNRMSLKHAVGQHKFKWCDIKINTPCIVSKICYIVVLTKLKLRFT